MMKKLIVLFLAFVSVFGAVFTAPLTAHAADTGGGTTSLYDENDKALYYHILDNTIFNADLEIAYDSESGPVYYDPVSKEFTNSKTDPLSTFERVGGGNYLVDKGKKISTFDFNESYYKVPVKEKYGGGMRFVRSVYVKYTFWERLANSLVGNHTEGYYKYYDMYGNTQLVSEFEGYSESYTDYVGYTWLQGIVFQGLFITYEKATLWDFLVKIELDHPDGNVPSLNENAIALLARDDRGFVLYEHNGQVFDWCDYPIFASDYMPVCYDNGIYYRASDGLRLTVKGGILYDGDFAVRSILSIYKDNENLYDSLLYTFRMRHAVTPICVVRGEPVLDKDGKHDDGKMRYYLLNGKEVDYNIFLFTDIDLDDLYNRRPDIKPEAYQIGDGIKSILKIFDDILAWFRSAWAWICNFWWVVLLGIGAVILAFSVGVPLFFRVLWLIISAPFRLIASFIGGLFTPKR